MTLTTWDGHLRLDRPPGSRTVTLTLLTVEPTIEAELRTGLVAGFVTADPHGPPAFVGVTTADGRLPADVATLFGRRVADSVAALIEADGAGEWLQLDLLEIDELAAAWAPYRVRVVQETPAAAATTVGSWADGLWACVGLPDWRSALDAAGGLRPAGQFRGGDGERPEGADPSALRGDLLLPGVLASAAGCARAVSWTVRLGSGDTDEITVTADRVDPATRATLLVGLDDTAGQWVPFEADASGRLRARTRGSGGPVNLRFRTEPEDRS
ncbi:MAG: hypothetical protein ACR2GH_07350 [Pseudonocardia sp.]